MTIGVNLIPYAIQAKRARLRRVKAWILPVALAAGLVLTPIVLETFRRAETRELCDQVDRARTRLALDRTKLRDLTANVAGVHS